ncbi:glycosyl hydrolase family 115 (putative glucuronidase) [Neobacillus bataviensis]|uniref:Glycosyl hydrolase family 115 (Putative glucuronidase) n=1 Tax=Neobacillus bataviensis TaxID=220685 RepID=A0A561CRQ7_9BACI|nr:glycosyl hydrolase 115 family protein [Neobacillus bataviensis]TWD93730.1 glycosyl hydrolase family 115 (putative glucuronidase) [Neobacillus bataviensis]
MINQSFVIIDENTVILPPENISTPVGYALDMIVRDHKKVVGKAPKLVLSLDEGPDLIIRYASKEDDCPDWQEGYCFRFNLQNGKPVMHIIGNDDLGIIYGLLHYSKDYLGIDPFWFWANLPIQQKTEIKIPFKNFNSRKAKVKYRGWFVNDEVCLIGWKKEYPPTKEVWYPVFEALLRCGGNMVIPGTDLPKHGIHAELASEMGLWLTHHHAEPLGAEMFLRAYPGKQPNYQQNPELFENLWKEAIEKQKHQKIIWVLSFRGQGDAPFWQYAPEFDTPEKRGDMISKVVARQYELIRQSVDQPVCSMALYGEIAELYKEGHIKVPEGVIYIWADNGYGKMVSRRQGNENLRIPSLPTADDPGEHGIYYHITFHDLQASNHLTMYPSPPEMIIEEVEKAFEARADSYLLLNSGNIRPHLYPLDLISELWSKGTVNQEKHLEGFIRRLYQTGSKQIEQLYQSYFNQSIPYGEHEDDRAGEEFYHHPARKIIGHWLRGKVDIPLSKLFWATGEIPFDEQVLWFKNKCEDGQRGWEKLLQACRNLSAELGEEDQQRFYDQFTLHVELHVSGCKGFIALCNAYFHYEKQEYALAFVRVSQSIRHYNDSILALKRAEHGKWENFYRADWLTNVKSTLYSLDALRKFIRMQGDSPDFFLWYKDYLMPETEKYIYLENTHRNPLSDDELSNRLEELFIQRQDI